MVGCNTDQVDHAPILKSPESSSDESVDEQTEALGAFSLRRKDQERLLHSKESETIGCDRNATQYAD